MTPVQLNCYARAYAERGKNEQRVAQANIYSLAALIRPMVWSKDPPGFDKVFPQEHWSTDMTDEELFRKVQALNAMFGGEEVN